MAWQQTARAALRRRPAKRIARTGHHPQDAADEQMLTDNLQAAERFFVASSLGLICPGGSTLWMVTGMAANPRQRSDPCAAGSSSNRTCPLPGHSIPGRSGRRCRAERRGRFAGRSACARSSGLTSSSLPGNTSCSMRAGRPTVETRSSPARSDPAANSTAIVNQTQRKYRDIRRHTPSRQKLSGRTAGVSRLVTARTSRLSPAVRHAVQRAPRPSKLRDLQKCRTRASNGLSVSTRI